MTDAEKGLLAWLAVRTVAIQTGASARKPPPNALETSPRRRAELRGDSHDAYVVVAGHPLVHITREALAFYANAGEWEDPP